MPVITRELLRKRSEHNEGIISTLEEITLHQEELENINEVLGMTCKKIKILYLQNNIISRMENLFHLKDLNYLNLALNNIKKIEGLNNCEFLSKLDLTANFIDFDNLEESMNNLVHCSQLKDLYMMGNPAEALWKDKFVSYVIAKLPQLKYLDGTEITKSMQITSKRNLPKLEIELKKLIEDNNKNTTNLKETTIVSDAQSKKNIYLEENVSEIIELDEEAKKELDRNRITENTPESRIEIYKELAEQKKEKADREKANQPRERDYEKEHAVSLQNLRQIENEKNESEIKQKNEGGWTFTWDEESTPGLLILDVAVSRFLDSSLIDADIHPTYISIVIKGKCLRLRLPVEVSVSTSKCQRSKTTGSLRVTMPKINPKENVFSLTPANKSIKKQVQKSNQPAPTVQKMSLQQQMLRDASLANLSPSVDNNCFSNIVKHNVEPVADMATSTMYTENATPTRNLVTEI